MLANDLVPERLLVDVHHDTMVGKCLFLVFLQQEVESLRKSSLTRRAKKIVLDVIGIRVPTPDDAKRFKDVTINMSARLYWPSEFFNRRSRDIENPGSIRLHPRVFENLGHLMTGSASC